MFTLKLLLLGALTFTASSAAVNDELVIAGTYADADIVALDDGTFLMYYGVEPENTTEFEIYVATSADGLTWTEQAEPVLTLATFPDAIQLPSGEIRLYFQRAGEIYSAVSSDGITNFEVESGVRITSETRLDTDGVGAPTVVTKPDGSYYMIFRGAVPRPYTSTSVNSTTTVFIGATSVDGLTWERQGVVVNGRHAIYDGYIDGPELYYNPAGKLRLRYWAPGGFNEGAVSGHFEKKSKNDGENWKRRTLVINDILGGDPTYTYINNQLYMYYTLRGEGIYLRVID